MNTRQSNNTVMLLLLCFILTTLSFSSFSPTITHAEEGMYSITEIVNGGFEDYEEGGIIPNWTIKSGIMFII